MESQANLDRLIGFKVMSTKHYLKELEAVSLLYLNFYENRKRSYLAKLSSKSENRILRSWLAKKLGSFEEESRKFVRLDYSVSHSEY